MSPMSVCVHVRMCVYVDVVDLLFEDVCVWLCCRCLDVCVCVDVDVCVGCACVNV